MSIFNEKEIYKGIEGGKGNNMFGKHCPLIEKYKFLKCN
jgi:hypothetical protein